MLSMVYVGGCGMGVSVRAGSWVVCGWCRSEEFMICVHACLCVELVHMVVICVFVGVEVFVCGSGCRMG